MNNKTRDTSEDEKLWSESPLNSQSCIQIETNPQCLNYYNGLMELPQQGWEKGKIQPPSKEDNWIIRDYI